MVVAGERLHDDADEHRHGEQKQLDDRDRREFGEPVDGDSLMGSASWMPSKCVSRSRQTSSPA